ncbi:MAG: hypothetical protein HY736_07735 [Verrucomicrobia bacterium]|nr:hypothetical protein [Verrucomicrobiota bacterium]
MTFSAAGLPPGLQLASQTGIIRGTTPARGEHVVTLRAANRHGQDRRVFKIVSGDMTKLDDFTLNVLCNPEVIAVNQDPLGQCARVVTLSDDVFLMVKDLEDGTKAVGLCNRGEAKTRVTARWSDLGVDGRQSVRDVWRHRNLGEFAAEFAADVPRHGVVMIKVARR